MIEAELNISNEELLSKLKLLSNGKLKRSAVLLFYGDPSIVQVGSFVKVGKFANGTVEYHDDLEADPERDIARNRLTGTKKLFKATEKF